jgi:hypothetical protein
MIPRRERILYTRYDGGVSITHPAAECMAWMSSGGLWADRPRGYVDEQIERQITWGHLPHAAWRFAHAIAFGGCTDAEALDIIRDRDCGHLGTAFELLDVSDIPTDRWFRDAWRRSHNGGPIYVDMRKARKIQLVKLTDAARKRNIELRMDRWRQRIRQSTCPLHLKQIWPKGLSVHG